MNVYVVLWLVFVIAPISTFLHEFGHVLGAKWLKADSIRLSIGHGKQIATFSWKQIHVSLRALFFLGGMAYNERNDPYNKIEVIFISICGPLSNAIAATVIFVLAGFSWIPVRFFIMFNIWLLVINLIPFSIKGKQSDGYTIWKTVSAKRTKRNNNSITK